MSYPLSGTVIQRYQLTDLLGRGGMSSVYRGVHLDQPQRQVAIKLLNPNQPIDALEMEEIRKRFLREIATLRTLKHPNILPILGYGEEFFDRKSLIYMILPLCEGGSLEDQLDHGLVDLRLVLHYFKSLAWALDYAHAHQIIHRDLKPGNVLLTGQHVVQLSDFGIVRFMGDQSTKLTRKGYVLGSPPYMSPEQIQGQVVRSTSDIYSLGIMLYEMITGDLPFHGPSDFDYMRQHATERPPIIRRADIPPQVAQVIMCALEKAPRRRYQTAGALAEALEAALPSAFQAPVLRPPTPPPAVPLVVPKVVVPPPAPIERPPRLIIGFASLVTIFATITSMVILVQRWQAMPMAALVIMICVLFFGLNFSVALLLYCYQLFGRLRLWRWRQAIVGNCFLFLFPIVPLCYALWGPTERAR